jgi:hypothetical protein
LHPQLNSRRLFAALVSVALVALLLVASAQGRNEAQPEHQQGFAPLQAASPAPTVSPEEQRTAQRKLLRKKLRKIRARVKRDRLATWHWQDVMLKPRSGVRRNLARMSELPVLRRHGKLWHARKLRANYQAHHPPMLWAWLCIHRHEAAWNNPGLTWDGRPSPYYGGLQMDRTFQATYNPRLYRLKGTANNWTKWEQIWTALKAYFSRRGFGPWPNTRIPCGV